jgi:geranylgeranyl transferase type-1 subunit beta
MKKFERLRHIRYFTTSLQSLPKQYSSADTNRLTLVHFAVQSLDILGVLPNHDCICGDVNEEIYLNKDEIIEWIYQLQTLPVKHKGSGSSSSSDNESRFVGGGFKGSNYLGPTNSSSCSLYDHSHLAMTYVALCTLIALGDDLSRVKRTAILDTLKGLQKEDGSFVAVSSNNVNEIYANESDDDCDLRFMYTAICIWYILSDDSPNMSADSAINKLDAFIDIEAATNYILSCISFDGSLGLTPGREGHGGSTFCGIASLYLMGVLDDVMQSPERSGWKDDLIRWCLMRQKYLPNENDSNIINNGYDENDKAAGMQGRPNKLEDTCYSYWIGGTLHLLGAAHLLDGWALREYVLNCQSPYGGFGKVAGAMPDLLHSFYSMAWLAISEEGGCCADEFEYWEVEGNALFFSSDVQGQVADCIKKLSRLDCALGMCAKRSFDMKNAVKSLQADD